MRCLHRFSEKLMSKITTASEDFNADELDAASAPPSEGSAVDKTFERFQRRIAVAPDQLLRYYHRDTDQADDLLRPLALWVTSARDACRGAPACAHCGAERLLECQVGWANKPTVIALNQTTAYATVTVLYQRRVSDRDQARFRHAGDVHLRGQLRATKRRRFQLRRGICVQATIGIAQLK